MRIDLFSTDRRHAFSKVPEVTAFFWIVKALTTAMGESTSDFLVHSLVPEIAVVLGGIAFCIALYLQFGKDRYVPWAYWLAVAMVGVFGTMAADVLHVGLGVPYIVSTIFYAIVLAVGLPGLVSSARARSRSTASPPRAARSSTGPPCSPPSPSAPPPATLPRSPSASATSARSCSSSAIIAIPALGYFRFGMNSILAFWFAYVVTRPLGASVADWLAVSSARGGLALGTGPVSLVLAAVIAAFVYYLAKTGKDTPPDQSAFDDGLVSARATAGVSA